MTLIMRILLVMIFFILPFSRSIRLQSVPIPELSLDVTPPGYPIEGEFWNIMTWGSVDNGLTWTVVKNANVSIITQNNGTFQLVSDTEGKASFQYFMKMGTVELLASHKEYGTCEWIPQESFVDNTLSVFVLSVFGLAVPSGIWQILLKNRRSNKLEKTLFYALLITSAAGWVLSLMWFVNWKLGTPWGFGNTIFAVANYRMNFDPHLWSIFIMVIILSFLNFLVISAHNLFGKSGKKRRNSDYLV